MPYELKVEGIEAVSDMLTRLGAAAEGAAALGLYDGAGIVADQLKRSAGAIQTAPFHYVTNGTRLPSPEEKAIVLAADAGIAKFDKNGSEVNTSVGYRNAGYTVLGKKVKPIPVIVNAINSGTSFMKKQPFVRKAARASKAPASAAMKKKIEERFKEAIKG